MYFKGVLHSRGLMEEFRGHLRGLLQSNTTTPMSTKKMYSKMIDVAFNPSMTTSILISMVPDMFLCFGINSNNISDSEKTKMSNQLVQELDHLYSSLSESIHSMKMARHSRDFVICSDNLTNIQICLIKCMARHYLRLDESEIRLIKILGASNDRRLGLIPSTNNLADYTVTTDLKTIRAMGSCNFPHVIKFYAGLIDKKESQIVICIEAYDTSMKKFYTTMHKMKETKHLDILLKCMINHIVDALQFLKSKGILHRDVKLLNILVKQDPITFKLCDFGIFSQLTNSVAHTMMKGTQVYLVPERIDATQAPKGYGTRTTIKLINRIITTHCLVIKNKTSQ
ncbi:unnamed protein product [Rotaria sordida]|uniref:mitogen-activated protein kinase kinase n=1 Tax=Rotaria sordida TaxID=392033 RepID=A0A815HEK1_9BILA|nr:unnamed protein product [Rotaria sordida]